jgi:chromosome partitioning protein
MQPPAGAALPLGLQAHGARSHLIVLGNEKGGSGKSTVAMHLVAGFLREGLSVGAIDLDARQGTLSHHVAARGATAARRGLDLPMPLFVAVARSEAPTLADAAAEDAAALDGALAEMAACDVVVLDCPGADTALARAAHARADTLITPINDSYVDFSMLGTVDPENRTVISPSIYSEMVWEARKQRFMRDKGRFDWIVMRNRIGAADARNKRDVGASLDELARRIGFRTVKGFGERVIFRELYLQGLTLMDVKEVAGGSLSISQVAARQEVRALMAAIRLPARAAGSRAATLAPALGAAYTLPIWLPT